jgi:hypothetical protein
MKPHIVLEGVTVFTVVNYQGRKKRYLYIDEALSELAWALIREKYDRPGTESELIYAARLHARLLRHLKCVYQQKKEDPCTESNSE